MSSTSIQLPHVSKQQIMNKSNTVPMYLKEPRDLPNQFIQSVKNQEENHTAPKRIRTALQQKLDSSIVCCNNYKTKTVFQEIPFDSYNRHKIMYLKNLNIFTFKHDFLDFAYVFLYTVDLRLTKIETELVLSNIKGNGDYILVQGLKEHLLILGQQLD